MMLSPSKIYNILKYLFISLTALFAILEFAFLINGGKPYNTTLAYTSLLIIAIATPLGIASAFFERKLKRESTIEKMNS